MVRAVNPDTDLGLPTWDFDNPVHEKKGIIQEFTFNRKHIESDVAEDRVKFLVRGFSVGNHPKHVWAEIVIDVAHTDGFGDTRVYPEVFMSLFAITDEPVWKRQAQSAYDDYDLVDLASWTGMFSKVTKMAALEHRKGYPLIRVVEREPVPEGQLHKVFPFLQANKNNVIYGPGGIGKSIIANYLATLAVQNKDNHNGLKVNGSPSVLYLDYEDDEEAIGAVHEAISRSMGMDGSEFFFYKKGGPGSLVDNQEELARLCLEQSIDLVVIDSGARACPNAVDDKEVNAYFTALDQLQDVTTLTLCHVSKGRGPEGGPFGSQFWRSNARNAWEVKAEAEPGEDFLEVGMYHTKVNGGAIEKDVGFRIEFSGHPVANRIKFHRVQLSETNLAKNSSPREILKVLLREREFATNGINYRYVPRPMSLEDIYTELREENYLPERGEDSRNKHQQVKNALGWKDKEGQRIFELRDGLYHQVIRQEQGFPYGGNNV